MAPTRRTVLGVTVMAIGLAGCAGESGDGGDDGASPSPTTTTAGGTAATTTRETTTTDATTTDDGAMAVAVEVATHPDHGEILVDADGTTLYMFDSDTRGEPSSACSGGCAEAWPPLVTDGTPTAGAGVSAELTTFERADGSTQVAANGWPLYHWQGDDAPGDATGQGVNDVWWVLDASGVAMRENTRGGSGSY